MAIESRYEVAGGHELDPLIARPVHALDEGVTG